MTYTCSACKGTFDAPDDHDAVARKEAEDRFGGKVEEMVIVCDVCYQSMMTLWDAGMLEAVDGPANGAVMTCGDWLGKAVYEVASGRTGVVTADLPDEDLDVLAVRFPDGTWDAYRPNAHAKKTLFKLVA